MPEAQEKREPIPGHHVFLIRQRCKTLLFADCTSKESGQMLVIRKRITPCLKLISKLASLWQRKRPDIVHVCNSEISLQQNPKFVGQVLSASPLFHNGPDNGWTVQVSFEGDHWFFNRVPLFRSSTGCWWSYPHFWAFVLGHSQQSRGF